MGETYNAGSLKHGVIIELIDHIDLELISLNDDPTRQTRSEWSNQRPTLLPVIKEPTTPSPPAEMAVRAKPSGEASMLTMLRSVTGPMAHNERVAHRRIRGRDCLRRKDMVLTGLRRKYR